MPDQPRKAVLTATVGLFFDRDGNNGGYDCKDDDYH